jgi:hypothetical protein
VKFDIVGPTFSNYFTIIFHYSRWRPCRELCEEVIVKMQDEKGNMKAKIEENRGEVNTRGSIY